MPLLADPKRLVVGRPLRSDRLGETLLPKRLALPVFCSDPLSSVAYATEQIVLVLGLGGLALLHLTPWLGLAVVALLLVVVASYRQTCHAYPNGGGAYVVSRTNLGVDAGLVAASALLVDYVLTVAVSVVAGVAAITSAVPSLAAHAVALSLGFVVLLTLANLRGVRESGRLFAIPTYLFVVMIFLLLLVAAATGAGGGTVRAESAGFGLQHATRTTGLFAVFLAMRAFASGCTALTGVEAISNGVPSFQEPKADNAARTLGVMGLLAVTMFAGITALAVAAHVHMSQDPSLLTHTPHGYVQRTALAQLGRAVFGSGPLFLLLQAATAAILVLAANTAFNGFPVLASILGRDGFLPRQLAHRGDRLVFSNGIVILAGLAGVLIVAFDASVNSLIHLYIIGVFVSFTLSQAGMVRHWETAKRRASTRKRYGRLLRKQAVNALGAAATAVVLVIVLVTKFLEGAWIVCIAMPLLFWTMKAVQRHYQRVRTQLAPLPGGERVPGAVHAVVPVSQINRPALRALAYARALAPATLQAVTVEAEDQREADSLRWEWKARGIDAELVRIASPYREVTGPLIAHLRALRDAHPGDAVSVIIPEYVVGKWWEQLLHNQSALRLKARLLFEPGITVTSVPWIIGAPTGEAAPAAEAGDPPVLTTTTP